MSSHDLAKRQPWSFGKLGLAFCSVIFVYFSLQGREVILRYMRKGTLMNNYAHIFAIMMRLRQLCCHRELLPINWAGIDMNDLVGWAQRQIQQQGPPGTSLKISLPIYRKLRLSDRKRV